LSKEERAKLAIAKRAQEIKEEKEKAEREKQDRENLEREAEEIRARERDRGRDSRYGSGGGRCQCFVNHSKSSLITCSLSYVF
jgi:ATP-dependent RNA helicase DDX23/PRP28